MDITSWSFFEGQVDRFLRTCRGPPLQSEPTPRWMSRPRPGIFPGGHATDDAEPALLRDLAAVRRKTPRAVIVHGRDSTGSPSGLSSRSPVPTLSSSSRPDNALKGARAASPAGVCARPRAAMIASDRAVNRSHGFPPSTARARSALAVQPCLARLAAQAALAKPADGKRVDAMFLTCTRAARLAPSSSGHRNARLITAGPASSASVTKCTVAPCSVSRASRTRRCVQAWVLGQQRRVDVITLPGYSAMNCAESSA
jgi:hypothetical protein